MLVLFLWLLASIVVGGVRTISAVPGDAPAAYYLGRALGTLLTLVFDVSILVLAILVLRGSQVARILTWVMSGLGFCCFGFFGLTRFGGVSAVDSGQVALLALGVLMLLINTAVAVLLALPRSNAYFRPKPQFDPYGAQFAPPR
jgi:hypothetical protein